VDAQNLGVAALYGAAALYAIALVASSVRLARVADAKAAGAEVPARDRPSGIAGAAATVGLALHAIGLVARGVEAGHVPWSTMYEFTITFSFAAVATYMIVRRWRDVAWLGPAVTGMATVALGLALAVLYREGTELQPALQSAWLAIHVSVATIATGVFSVAFLATLIQLARVARDRDSRVFARREWRRLETTPEPRALEALSFRLNAVGFILWTFTVMAGSIWAEHAWGRYWGWDPKEIWSFVVWVIYAAYLHARTTQGWQGRRASALALAGFAAIILNFTLVNLVFSGLHSYAGV
jgi:cytochrome c-type biogenesis protein CcsB